MHLFDTTSSWFSAQGNSQGIIYLKMCCNASQAGLVHKATARELFI